MDLYVLVFLAKVGVYFEQKVSKD